MLHEYVCLFPDSSGGNRILGIAFVGILSEYSTELLNPSVMTGIIAQWSIRSCHAHATLMPPSTSACTSVWADKSEVS